MLRMNTDPTVRRGTPMEPTVPHKFTIDGQPLPKERPRQGKDRRTGELIWYTPTKTKKYEAFVGWSYKASRGLFYEGYIGMAIAFFRKTNAKVDIDNLIKCCLDGLNDVAFRDDKQVIHLETWRLVDKANPRTEVKMWAISQEQWEEMCTYQF